MEPKRLNWLAPLLKEAASWAVFLWGIAIGVLGTTFFGGSSAGLNDKADWVRLVGLGVFGMIPLLGSLLALRNRKQGANLFLLSAFVIAVILIVSNFHFRTYDEGSVLAVAAVSSIVLLPGLFWRITARWEWRPLIAGKRLTGGPYRQPLILNAALLLTLVLTCSFLSLYRPQYELNCYRGLPPVSAQTSPRQVVFTGKVLTVGHRMPGWSSPWALIRVERVYWGMPRWMRWIVFVHGYFRETDKGQEYFVDAYRSERALTRFLPVVEFYPCCHSMPLSDAAVDLRVLQEGRPKSSARIIGRVYDLRADTRGKFVPDSPVLVTGPAGLIPTLTDKDGIYDLRDLPPGHYSIRAGARDYGADLKTGDVWGEDLYLPADAPR